MRGRSGTVVVIICLAVGLSVGALGAWWVVHARPGPGAFVDVLATPDGVVAVRHERASGNSFLEAYDGPRRRWHAMVPPYLGAPGKLALAASPRSVTVRVARGGHPFVFAFDAASGAKLDSFDLVGDVPPDAAAYTLPAVATVVAGSRSVEILGAPDGGAQLIGVELDQRRLLWKHPLPWVPAAAWIAGDVVVLADAQDGRIAFGLGDGAPAAPAGAAPGLAGLTYDAARRELRAASGATYALPADALAPAPHHVAAGVVWIVTPRAITALDTSTLAVVATVR